MNGILDETQVGAVGDARVETMDETHVGSDGKIQVDAPRAGRRWSRRGVLAAAGATFLVGAGAGATGALAWARQSRGFLQHLRGRQREAAARIAHKVLPPGGHDTGVSFGDAITKLVEAGAVDPGKFRRLYARRGGTPGWVGSLLDGEPGEPIKLSMENAPYLLNLLWPVGLANTAAFNARSPINGPKVGNYASTGGWTLGRAPRGGGYFNRVAAVALTPEQEVVAGKAAEASFRPCCNNSAFFQDCNHGSALLGLYQLAAARGMDGDALPAMGVIANSYWYPEKYLEMAVFFEQVKGTPWEKVSPATIMSAEYSSITGWTRNVHDPLVEAGVLPGKVSGGGAGCAV